MSRSLAAVAAAVVVSLAAAAPARADKPRVAVVGVGGDSATPELRQRMSEAVAAGLAASGADVRTEPGEVAYRVRGTVDVEGRNYTLRLEIVDVKTGEIVDTREDRCEICTESEALETAGLAASALKAQVWKRRPTTSLGELGIAGAGAGGGGAARSAGGAAAADGQASALGLTASSETPPRRQAAHRKLGAAGLAVGAVAVAAGVWLLAIHGDYTGCVAGGADQKMWCRDRWNTRAGGVALTALGGLALVAGVLGVAGTF